MVGVLVILLFLGLGGALVYFQYRKLLREAKNYERGLKMVSLVIHLPPSSEDTELGSRDTRDVAEETISKAQVMYNILASTVEEGFKRRYYGQRHIGFEIVAKKGAVRFYAAVPITLVPVVEQAIVSAYPSAQVEEVPEHNIFSPVGKISGTIGGELELKEDSAKPIATFQESKRDALQAIFNAFSNLTNEDGAALQLLIRPAGKEWSKSALKVASNMRDKKKSTSTGSVAKELATALWKPPEAKDDKKEPDKPLSALEQSNIEAVESKTRHPGFETLIRVIASSNTASRSQNILNNMVATFALFDAPGKNGFKFSPAKDIENFVTAFIFRFFPQESKRTILNSIELATIFHLPEQRGTSTSSLERQSSKQVDGPNKLPESGPLLGYNVFRGVKKEIRLSEEDRRRHLYIVGQTGTGKTVLLENLALYDMLDGRGFAFIDPHGDAVERLISMVPKERTEDVIYFSPADMDQPMGLNLFEFQNPEQKDFLIQEAINMLYKLYDPGHTGIIGPRYEHWFRNAALTLMSDPNGSTFIDIPKIFTDNRYAKQKLKYVTDPTVREFWEGEMAKTSDYHKSEVLGWFVSKFGAFMSNEMMRNIVGQTKSSVDLRQVMDEGKILLVNLSKGRTGELNSKLLGMIFVMKFQAAAMSRAAIPEEHRRDFSLYVDEFQNFSTDSFATILSEARKYRLNLIVANQFTTQLSEEVKDAVFGNVGSIAALRAGPDDADYLVKQFSPVFDQEDIVKLPNYNAIVRLMISGVPSQPFSLATIPPLGHPNPELGQALKRLSAAKYGRSRAKVETEIFERLKTAPEPPIARPFESPFGQPPALGSSRRPTPPGGTSFLDEWLAKRRTQPPKPATDQSKSSPSDSTAEATNQSTDQKTDAQPNQSPTAFARAKASGQINEPESQVSGALSDKDEVANLANLVKDKISEQPNAEVMDKAAVVSPSQPGDAASGADIKIDEHGNLSYDEGKAA
ncbi:MAG TPA: ATP-binding protein [Candidatus Saccharimonadales bacterium]